MPSYEKVVDGEVVETVHTVEGSHNDTEFGVLALEGTDGWRPLADPKPGPEHPPAEPEPATVPERPAAVKKAARGTSSAG